MGSRMQLVYFVWFVRGWCKCSYFQVILKHFWLKRKEIKEQIELWLADQEVAADQKTGVKAKSYQSISHNTVLLKVGHTFYGIVSFLSV